ncbi:threonine/serine exporter family protein [Sporolactobacillus shoreicorticis]|uniref:Threonine/serine exporter family protein n=1 Tax=Sporolactobacillus shoreicorticis TaxID=1923877 RepID=A0ABW5S098_9BACL|nr:threonine/serine exporter family protein [Sporolactobacillus shoreicorticis]MCO7126811.1 threonine/serine exporter family protein [Sporolactobacillus shoreicorticis]
MHLFLVITIQSITSYLATCAFGIIFNSPFKPLIHGGLIGMIAWLIYFFLFHFSGNDFIATFAASLVIALMSQIFARLCKNPVILYSVSGIIPLVPGGLSYSVMSRAVDNNYDVAIYFAEKVFVLSGAIAMGLIFAEVFYQIFEKIKHRASRKITAGLFLSKK